MRAFENNFEFAIDALDRVETEEELKEIISKILNIYGLRQFVYHAVRLPGRLESNPILILSYPDEWVTRYVQKNYFGIDPVVAAGATAILPVDWAKLDKRSFHARKLFGEANEFGVGRQGLTFPVRGGGGDHALFTITSDASASEWERLKRLYMRDFQMIAHLVHGKVLDIRGMGDCANPQILSPRERECLQWAARGKTNKAIARELRISERVVRAYFETARHKLHCVNRSHVLSRALGLGLIEPDAG